MGYGCIFLEKEPDVVLPSWVPGRELSRWKLRTPAVIQHMGQLFVLETPNTARGTPHCQSRERGQWNLPCTPGHTQASLVWDCVNAASPDVWHQSPLGSWGQPVGAAELLLPWQHRGSGHSTLAVGTPGACLFPACACSPCILCTSTLLHACLLSELSVHASLPPRARHWLRQC